MEAASYDPRAVNLSRRYSEWYATNPNHLTPKENVEYMNYVKLSVSDPTREERDRRYEGLFRELVARDNRRVMSMLTAPERERWQHLQGKAIAR